MTTFSWVTKEAAVIFLELLFLIYFNWLYSRLQAKNAKLIRENERLKAAYGAKGGPAVFICEHQPAAAFAGDIWISPDRKVKTYTGHPGVGWVDLAH